jgi:hypothetical protein
MCTVTEACLRAKVPIGFHNGINQLNVLCDISGDIIAQCTVHICTEETSILSLSVKEDRRGRSLGTLLIRAVCANTPADAVVLDDMSDRSGSEDSIYYKVGFRVDTPPFPEMTGSAREIVTVVDQSRVQIIPVPPGT